MVRTVHSATRQCARVKDETRSGDRAGLRLFVFAMCLSIAPLAVPILNAAPLPSSFKLEQPGKDTPMLVEADQMIYDYDNERVSALGHVQIYYGVYALEADKVTYDQKSARLLAEGNVRITEPDGNIITANLVDITDDFRTGFVRSLRVQTPQNARFAADKAERQDDDITVFDKGVYTTCEPCRENPKKSPLWQIKASRIIYNTKDKMIYYKAAKMEFLGIPLLYTPYFAHPDPSRKRQSGFLTPSVGHDGELGYYVAMPYFWALDDSYDVTFTPTYYSKQGLLAQATWRQHLGTGLYSVKFSGINQQDPSAFTGTSGDRKFRGAIQSKGQFNLSKKWKYGWDISMMTDKRFLRDYELTDKDAEDARSSLYLVGQGERNIFEAHASYYNILTDELDQSDQAVIHPGIDYSAFSKKPILGGEGRLQINSTTLTRDTRDQLTVGGVTRTYGIDGTYNRTSMEASWKRRFIAPGGQAITPFASLRGDVYWLPSHSGAPATLVDDDVAFRGMPTVGIDYRLPILATTGSTSHIFEPIAQVIVRPNETKIGNLPNDDSQSLIFDDTILFDPNKFSGWDRIEGGSRANIGFQYRMQMANGWSVNGLAGRSFHLSGRNSFASEDLTSTGLDSGLDKKVSDYVARVGVNSNRGISAVARGRFDSRNAELKYAALEATGSYKRVSGTVSYSFTGKRPSAGITETRQEITGAAAFKLTKNWTVSGGVRYDITGLGMAESELGLKYDDECFAASLNYEQTRAIYSDLTNERSIMLNIDFKSIGGGGIGKSFQ